MRYLFFLVAFLSLCTFVACDKDELDLELECTSRDADRQILTDFYEDEIRSLVLGQTCVDPTIWSAVGLGAKACGGVRFYLAYPNTINTEKLLKNVAEYNETEGQFNMKWGTISDCAITPEPLSVSCENGEAVFVY